MSAVPSAATVSRLEKVAFDNGFDRELPAEGGWLCFASSQAPVRLWLTAADDLIYLAALSMSHVVDGLGEFGDPLTPPFPAGAVGGRAVRRFLELHHFTRRAFQLSRTLPDALLRRFERDTTGLPRTTEAERLVVQRVGQDVFRQGLIEYWDGRCAVTGLGVLELLRASHSKPWAACASDAERLDVFNGLLLAPHLDAAFDQGLISVSESGDVLISSGLTSDDRRLLGLEAPLRVRRLEESHGPYLRFHRDRVFKRTPTRAHEPVVEQAPRGDSVGSPAFDRYVGVDYSGAETATSRLPGIRVFIATASSAPVEVRPDRGHWSRRLVAEWLVRRLVEPQRTIVGIDHCFSLPAAYFEAHGVPRDWSTFLDDFQEHWPTDLDDVYVDFVRQGIRGNGAARQGNARWRRLTEERAGGAKSAFHFDVPGSVAKSTHAGLPWLRYVRRQTSDRVHFWPFDGWSIAEGRSAVVEVYPSLWRMKFPQETRTDDEHDAYSVAGWLRGADRDGTLALDLNPNLSATDRATASFEGWILGTGHEADTAEEPSPQ